MRVKIKVIERVTLVLKLAMFSEYLRMVINLSWLVLCDGAYDRLAGG